MREHLDLPATLTLQLWPGPLTAGLSFEPTSAYVEQFYLPILGPACIFAARRLYTRAKHGVTTVDLSDLAWELGNGPTPRVDRRSRITQTLSRLVAFDMARWDAERGVYSLRAEWPLLNDRMINRLPSHLARHARPPEPVRAAG